MRKTVLILLVGAAAACANTADLGCMTDTECELMFPEEVCTVEPDCEWQPSM
jgi:hypothetical protein